MEDSKRLTFQEQELVTALESLSALESLVDVLASKVDEFDRRLCVAESLLEEIAVARD